MKLDLHTHVGSKYITSSEALTAVIAAAGLDGIAITNSKDIEVAQKIKSCIKGTHIIVGQEVVSTSYHVLALNISRQIEDGQPAAAIIEEIHDQGGVAILAHPAITRPHPGRLAQDIRVLGPDAVEIYNALVGPVFFFNWLAASAARRTGVAGIAASDTHFSPMYMGRSYIDIDFTGPVEFNERLRAGQFSVSTRCYWDFALLRFFLLRRCLLCGGKLRFGRHLQELTCASCGKIEFNQIVCERDHYLCSDCWGQRFRDRDDK